MRLKYLQSMAGDREVRNVGDEGDVNNAEAIRLIAAGFAEAVSKPKAGKKAKAAEVAETVEATEADDTTE